MCLVCTIAPLESEVSKHFPNTSKYCSADNPVPGRFVVVFSLVSSATRVVPQFFSATACGAERGGLYLILPHAGRGGAGRPDGDRNRRAEDKGVYLTATVTVASTTATVGAATPGSGVGRATVKAMQS